MSSPPAPDLDLDCRDLRCPLPVIELARRIVEVAPGGVVGVVTRDSAARVDVPAWCRMRRHEFLGESVAPDGVARYLVRRLT